MTELYSQSRLSCYVGFTRVRLTRTPTLTLILALTLNLALALTLALNLTLALTLTLIRLTYLDGLLESKRSEDRRPVCFDTSAKSLPINIDRVRVRVRVRAR